MRPLASVITRFVAFVAFILRHPVDITQNSRLFSLFLRWLPNPHPATKHSLRNRFSSNNTQKTKMQGRRSAGPCEACIGRALYPAQLLRLRSAVWRSFQREGEFLFLLEETRKQNPCVVGTDVALYSECGRFLGLEYQDKSLQQAKALWEQHPFPPNASFEAIDLMKYDVRC